MATIFDENGAIPLLDEAGSQVFDEAGAPAAPISMYPITITVEILVNGTWVDISQYVYQRMDIVISGGQPNQGSPYQPAKVPLTLGNNDGRFSPNNVSSPYYPYLQRNTQLRISVTATSTTGNFYSGYRFWGEVKVWPPTSDISGNDAYVVITANGPLRKIHRGGGQGSALTRYYNSLSGVYAPIAYWPCEEDPDTDIIGAGIDGGTSMAVTTGTPLWKAISDFNGSAPIGVLNNSTWDGLTGSFASSGDDIFNTPGIHQWQASTTTVDARVWGAGAGGGAYFGGGGGAGEFAEETTLAVTPGSIYNVNVGAGGSGGNASSFNGAPGGASSIAGDSVTVTANGGQGGVGVNGTGGQGGQGSTNSIHHNGGNGGNSAAGGGGGGGGSGGTSAAGNNGGNATGSVPGTGATAVTGGGKGGDGATTAVGAAAHAGSLPGGAGGGGGQTIFGFGGNGAQGASGKIELIYTPASQAAINVWRFILIVPKHGGNPGKVLARALTGGTIARLEVSYQSGGKLELIGYNNVGTQLFDSTPQSWSVHGQTMMVSVELANSGANVAWTFKAITPGSKTLIGSATGTVVTASCGNVSEVIAGPNADITKTAMGHFSVQYALIDLIQVSDALNGHISEMTVERLIRLGNEEAMNNVVVFREQVDHWGFEDGTTMGFGSDFVTPTNSSLSNSTTWSSDGVHSLLMTANGGGAMYALAPASAAFTPVNPGDVVSLHADMYAPAGASQAYIGIQFRTSGGAFISEVDSADVALVAGVAQTLKIGNAVAPATAAYCQPKVGDHASEANGTQLFIDHLRMTPRMGQQTRKELRRFLEEIQELDQGIMYENKQLFGLKYRTRFRVMNQIAAVTLDYSLGHLSAPLAPVFDDLLIKNHVVVHRHKGSKVTKVKSSGTGVGVTDIGRRKRLKRVIAETDKQIDAIAEFLLTLGTVIDERYPTVTVTLARAEVANIMSVLAGIEIGDFIQIINLASWFPSSSTKQLVIGYTETINAFRWDIAWNCQPESGWEVTAVNMRRW